MADNDDQRRGGDAGRGKRSVLRRGISAVASAGRAMLPSSSSSRPPPPLTQEDIGQMSVEELISLVDDDERMLELIQDDDLLGDLQLHITSLATESLLLPGKSKKENRKRKDELLQRIADLETRSANTWEPSSSSSRPTSLTPEVISQMSAEEVIALVNDDEQMLELIQDKGSEKSLRSRIEQLGDEGCLLPNKDQAANNTFSRKLIKKILNFEDTATIWDHFAQDPARIRNIVVGSSLKRGHEDVEDREDEQDREDSFEDGAKRVAVSQSAAESSTQREKPKGRKTPSSQQSNATTWVPECFMPLYAKAWKIEKDSESDAAIELFSGKRAMFSGVYCGLRNDLYKCFPESEVHGYMLLMMGYILEYGMTKVLPEVRTTTKVDLLNLRMEAKIQVSGFTYRRKVDVQISAKDFAMERELIEEFDTLDRQARLTSSQGERLEDLKTQLEKSEEGSFLTVLECKTPRTLSIHPIDLIDKYYVEKWAPRNKEVAKKENPDKYEYFKQVIENTKVPPPRSAKKQKGVDSIGSPVAQLCLYMISTGINFGALTNGQETYFFRRDSQNRTVEVSEAFYSNRNDNEGRANPGNWSLCQAWLVFLYHALKDYNPTREKNLNWLKDGSQSTEKTVDTYIEGDINVSVEQRSSEGSSSASTNNSTSRNGNSTRASRSRNRGPQRNAAVFAAFRLGPNLETPNMRTVLGGKAVGYPDIMINGVSSFVKTTYALHDSAYALGHEGQVYAALHALQGDVVPRVTACGLDETLNLVVFATEQCGKSLCDLHTRELEEYGGLEELYWKAALALDKIHKAGFIHGDVALRNIVVDDASNVKFIDLERSKKSRSEALREEDFNLLAEAFGIDSAKDFRTLSRTNNTEAHLENNEIV